MGGRLPSLGLIFFFVIFRKKMSFVFYKTVTPHLRFSAQESLELTIELMAGPLICVWQWWVFLHQVIIRGNKFFLLDDIDQDLLFVHTFCSQPALLPDPYPDHKARFCHGSKCYTLLVLSLFLYWTKNHSHPSSSVCISPFFFLPSHWLSPSKTYKREADYYYHFNCRGREKKT